MNVTLPLWLVAAQWALLLGLGGLVITMYRQIGYYLRLQRIGAENLGLAVGEPAPAFDFASGNDTPDTRGRFDPRGQWSLVLFADPRCGGCERALYALQALRARGSAPRLRALVVTRADAAQVAAADAFQRTTAEIALVADERVLDLYRVRKTPFAYVIDPQGVVRTKGVAQDQAALRDLLEPVGRPSIPLVPVAVASSGRS